MPQHKSAIKRVRQNKKRREHNRTQRSRLKTLEKKVYEIEDKEKAEEAFREAVAYLDKMASKGIVHRNYAARRKSKLSNYINNL